MVGYGMHVQNAAHRGFLITRYVRVPIFPSDVSRMFVSMDHKNLWMVFKTCGWVNMEFAKTTAKIFVLLQSQFLVSKKDH